MTEFLVFDTETTGFKPEEGHRIIELACVRIDSNGKELASFASLINIPGYEEIPTYSINKINRRMLADAPYFHEISSNFSEIANGAVMVAHNSGFDLNFLKYEYGQLGYDTSGFYAADTLSAARKILPNLPSYKLGELAKHFSITFQGEAHAALYDAKVTAELFIKLIEKNKKIEWAEEAKFNLVTKESPGSPKSR